MVESGPAMKGDEKESESSNNSQASLKFHTRKGEFEAGRDGCRADSSSSTRQGGRETNCDQAPLGFLCGQEPNHVAEATRGRWRQGQNRVQERKRGMEMGWRCLEGVGVDSMQLFSGS